MQTLKRYEGNPILIPNPKSKWDNIATFNGCPVELDGKIGLIYRADTNFISVKSANNFPDIMSTIGFSLSKDGKNFKERRQIIKPEYEWEKYGCEDPRVTKIQDEYFIFYTALSQFPFNAKGIKTAVAITKDFKKFEKHQVTTFNSKATVLFPEKINGKYVLLTTVNTDMPPETAKICIAEFDKKEDMFSPDYWNNFYSELDKHLIGFKRGKNEQSEVGTQPIKTKEGWLLIYSYTQNYFSENKNFTVEAILLDLKNPKKILGTTKFPIMVPKEEYELYGRVKNITFPSGAYVNKDTLYLYYGGADTITGLATCKITDLIDKILKPNLSYITLHRSKNNPLISPTKNEWENKATFNAAAVYLDKKIHLLYRAIGNDNISRIGYASLNEPEKIEKRLKNPVYFPREDFESKGCEDARITYIEKEEKLYMTYTAFDGKLPRVALTSISKNDFIKKNCNKKIIKRIAINNSTANIFILNNLYLNIANDVHRINGKTYKAPKGIKKVIAKKAGKIKLKKRTKNFRSFLVI